MRRLGKKNRHEISFIYNYLPPLPPHTPLPFFFFAEWFLIVLKLCGWVMSWKVTMDSSARRGECWMSTWTTRVYCTSSVQCSIHGVCMCVQRGMFSSFGDVDILSVGVILGPRNCKYGFASTSLDILFPASGHVYTKQRTSLTKRNGLEWWTNSIFKVVRYSLPIAACLLQALKQESVGANASSWLPVIVNIHSCYAPFRVIPL